MNEAYENPVLQAENICKYFGDIPANQNISLSLRPGCIHALLGENGAGKSTLFSILYGLIQPDSGCLRMDGNPVVLRHPVDAIHRGVGLVQQHFSLIPGFSVLDNILLGDEPVRGPFLDSARAKRTVQDRLLPLGFDLPLQRLAGDLPVGVQQQVEIAKILYRQARIMLFDEPTAALVSTEIDQFLDTILRLRDQGIAILLITHRLPEVMRVADEVTVLRQGCVVLQSSLKESSEESIALAIVGDELPEERYELPEEGDSVLRMDRVSILGSCTDRTLSLEIREREILGITGVAGNGQEELIQVLLGLKPAGGELYFQDKIINRISPRERRKMGIAYIPQDRIHQGLLPSRTIFDNYLLNQDALAGAGGWTLDTNNLKSRVEHCIQDYQIKTVSPFWAASSLSGGHQQRLILSREMLSRPRFILAYDPTRGLDLRATRFVHEQLMEECRKGAGILLLSSEWQPLFLLCRRIGVLYRGELVEIRKRECWTPAELGRCMVGISHRTEEA